MIYLLTFRDISDRQQKDPEVAPLSNREGNWLRRSVWQTTYPQFCVSPWRHLHFFRGFKKWQISQAALKSIWATWKHSCRSAAVSSRSLLISDVASWKFHRHCHFAKFGCRRITGVVWTVVQTVGASACKSTQLVAPMGHHVLSCCLPSFAGWCRAKQSGKKIPSTSQGWDGHDLFVRQVPAQDSEHTSRESSAVLCGAVCCQRALFFAMLQMLLYLWASS